MKKIITDILLFIPGFIGRVWVFACIPHIDDDTNYVFNYVLQNNKRKWLERLWEREPLWADGYNGKPVSGWVLPNGFIKYQKVTAWKFYLIAIFRWGFCDADSNERVTDIGYINSLNGVAYRAGGEDRRKTLAGRVYGPFVPTYKKGDVVEGNYFDLGDKRAEDPYFDAWAAAAWYARNPMRNIRYLWLGY